MPSHREAIHSGEDNNVRERKKKKHSLGKMDKANGHTSTVGQPCVWTSFSLSFFVMYP